MNTDNINRINAFRRIQTAISKGELDPAPESVRIGTLDIVSPSKKVAINVQVLKMDCLDVCRLLRNAGEKVCLLNMASESVAGGGVKSGAKV